MNPDDLDLKCRKAILAIEEHVKDIDDKLTHFIENYRVDYYKARNGIYHQKGY